MVLNLEDVPLSAHEGFVYRVISTRYPAVDLFERVADKQAFEILHEIESATNPRLRQEVGDLSIVKPEDQVFGPGSSYIMSPFTHPPVDSTGGRFNRDFGVYYCSPCQQTAIKEKTFHYERFLIDSRVNAGEAVSFRVLRAQALGYELLDLRRYFVEESPFFALYSPDDYSYPQLFGERARKKNAYGIFYKSVRWTGDCIAFFRPPALAGARHLKYVGGRFTGTAIDIEQQNHA